MKFDNVIINACIDCSATENLSAYIFTYDYEGFVKPDIFAYCSDCRTLADNAHHPKMTIEEAKLMLIKERL